jgi:hypothetical protein
MAGLIKVAVTGEGAGVRLSPEELRTTFSTS